MSFSGELRNELLNGEIFCTLREEQALIENWRSTTTESGRTAHSAIGRRHRRRHGSFDDEIEGRTDPRSGLNGQTSNLGHEKQASQSWSVRGSCAHRECCS